MPLFDYCCPNGHKECGRYVARFASADEQSCRTCGARTVRQFSVGAGRMLFFEEGRARRILTLDGGKEEIRSYSQFERLQQRQGVAQVSKDDMLHLTAQDAMKRRPRKRDAGWMREFFPNVASSVKRNRLTMEGKE